MRRAVVADLSVASVCPRYPARDHEESDRLFVPLAEDDFDLDSLRLDLLLGMEEGQSEYSAVSVFLWNSQVIRFC